MSSPQAYRLEELDGLERCSRERLRATVEQLELATTAASLLKIVAGPDGCAALRLALEHRIEQLKPEHVRASCSICRELDQVPR